MGRIKYEQIERDLSRNIRKPGSEKLEGVVDSMNYRYMIESGQFTLDGMDDFNKLVTDFIAQDLYRIDLALPPLNELVSAMYALATTIEEEVGHGWIIQTDLSVEGSEVSEYMGVEALSLITQLRDLGDVFARLYDTLVEGIQLKEDCQVHPERREKNPETGQKNVYPEVAEDRRKWAEKAAIDLPLAAMTLREEKHLPRIEGYNDLNQRKLTTTVALSRVILSAAIERQNRKRGQKQSLQNIEKLAKKVRALFDQMLEERVANEENTTELRKLLDFLWRLGDELQMTQEKIVALEP